MGRIKRKSKDDIEGTEPNTKVRKEETNSENTKILTETESQTQLPAAFQFDIKHFRKELSNSTGQTIVLTQFLQTCTNPDDDYDYLLEYLKFGGNAHEILKQVGSDNKKNLTLATPAFHIFQLVLAKVQSSLPHMIAITEEACRYFLNTFIPTVEIMISEHSGPKHRKIVLKLLTSMVLLSPELGIEVLNQVPLTPKNLQYLTEKTNHKEKDNVRSAFMHFITSFLIDGHVPLLKAFLEKQGLISLVLPGLLFDDGEVVMMFLNILKKNVILNLNISKSMKLRIFSHQVLHNFFKIFYWKGPPMVSSVDSKEEMRKSICDLLYEVLQILCTSSKYGLYFVDHSLGTSDVHKNQNLFKALQSLRRPWENDNLCELILEIVNKCPDLHRAVINIIEPNVEPQHSQIWEQVVQFIVKLYTSMDPQTMLTKMDNMNAIQITNFIRFTTLPIPLLKYLTPAINIKDVALATECIKVLVKMMSSMKIYLRNLNNNIIDLVKGRLEAFIPKHFPSAENVIVVLNQLLSGEEVKKSTQSYVIPRPDTSEMLINILDLLLLYCELQPALLESVAGSIDIKRLLLYANTLVEGNITTLKFKIVSLLLSLDKFVISPEKPLFKDLLTIMVEVCAKDDDNISIEAEAVLFNFLKNTNIFESDESEIDLLLYILRNMKIETLPNIIVQIIENVSQNLFEYKEQVLDIYSKWDLSKIDNTVNFNELFDKVQLEQQVNNSYSYLTQPTLTPFIIGCTHVYKKHKNVQEFIDFFSVYVVNLLHIQETPNVLNHILEGSKIKVKSYVKNWMQEPKPINVEIYKGSENISKLSQYLLDQSIIQLEEIFPLQLEETSENVCHTNITLNDIVYKQTSFEIRKHYELVLLINLAIFNLLQQAELSVLDENRANKIDLTIAGVLKLTKCLDRSDFIIKIIRRVFANKKLLSMFSPIETMGNINGILVTNCTTRLIQLVKSEFGNLPYIDSIFKAYRQKLYLELKCELKKILKNGKGIEYQNIESIIRALGIGEDESLELLHMIFQQPDTCMITDDKQPSLCVSIISHVLKEKTDTIHSSLPPVDVVNIFDLYARLLKNYANVNLKNLEDSLYFYLKNHIENIDLITAEHFEVFFSTSLMRKSTSQLASLLLQNNDKLCNIFRSKITVPEVLSQRELALPLCSALLLHEKFLNENPEILQKLYEEYKVNIGKILEKPHKASQIYLSNHKLVKKILIECMDIVDCENFLNKVHKFEMPMEFHIQLLHSIFLKISILSKGSKPEYFVNYLLNILNLSSLVTKQENEDETVLCTIVKVIREAVIVATNDKSFETKNHNQFKKIVESASWQNFCKFVLKISIKINKIDESSDVGPLLLRALSVLVKLFYPNNHEDIEKLFDMATSHSEFLNVMLSNHSSQTKSRLLELLFILINRNKSVMKSPHIPVYLSAYGATRSPSDRLILTIMHLYECQGQPMHEYKPYVWGDSAANYYSVRKKRSASLWSHPTPHHILNLLEKDIVEKTIKNFPIHQRLYYHYELPQDILECPNDLHDDASIELLLSRMTDDSLQRLITGKTAAGSRNTSIESQISKIKLRSRYSKLLYLMSKQDYSSVTHRINLKEYEEIYDPAFLLPLLSHMLAPGTIVSSFKLLRTSVLAIPVMALASYCPMMRAAAYHVLHRFYCLLETEMRHKNDKLLLTDFIDTLKMSLSTAIQSSPKEKDAIKGFPNPRLPAVAAMYLSRALMAITAPFDPLYKPINNFFIAKQKIDFSIVPDFLGLLHDSEVEAMHRRTWILEVMRDGTKSVTDSTVILKTMSLKMILDLYSTVITDRKTRHNILTLLSSLLSIPRAANILVESYSILSWLSCTFRNFKNNDKGLVVAGIKLVSNIWYSLAANIFSRIVSNVKKNQPGKMFNKNQGEQDTAPAKLDLMDRLEEIKIPKDIEQQVTLLLLDLMPHLHSMSCTHVNDFLKTFSKLSNTSLKLISSHDMSLLVKISTNAMKSNDNNKFLKALDSCNVKVLLNDHGENNQDPESQQCCIYLKEILTKYLRQ